MNVYSEQLGNLHTLLKIQIDSNDYSPKFEKAIKDLGKKANLKGFRPGNVPAGMVKKLYGDQALADELNKLVNEQMAKFLKDNTLEILGEPLPAEDHRIEIDYNSNKSYTFSFELGIQPKIDVADVLSQGKTFTRYKIPAKLEEIEAEVGRILKRYGKQEEAESANEGDVIYAHLHELGEDGNPKAGGIHAHTYFNFEMLTDLGLDIFKGCKKEEMKNIPDVFNVFKGEKEGVIKNILQVEKVSEEMLASISSAFECRIEKIMRLFPAELNTEVFEKLSKEYGDVKNEEELQNKIKEIIEAYNDQLTEAGLDNEVYKHLIDTTNVPLPEVFLQKWFRGTLEKELDGEEFEKQFESFKTRLKQSLIFQQVRKSNNLEVNKDEIIEETVMQVRSSYGSMGDDLVNYIVQNNLQDKNFIENMHDRVMQKKFFEVLKSFISTTEELITLEEYQKLNKEVEYAE